MQPQAVGAVTRLRDETGSLQRRAWCSLTLFDAGTSWLDYRLYLCRMYGFLAPIERALDETPELAAVIRDAPLRNNKVALLAHDLVSLGVPRAHLGQLPRIAAPALDELPEALGWMYILEAGTLEARELGRHLAPLLPEELEGASAYLRCYGDEVAARWRAFGAALDAYATRAGAPAADRIVAAATDGFLRLHRWLAPASAPAVFSGSAGFRHTAAR